MVCGRGLAESTGTEANCSLRRPGQAGSTGENFDWHFEALLEVPFGTQGKRGKHFEAQHKPTRWRIAQKYTTCQVLSGYHSNGAVKC